MPSALDNLAGPGGPLRRERFDAKEFAGLVRSATARLEDARLVGDLVAACERVRRAIAELPERPDA